MARYRCNTCQGEYADVGSDGIPYAHVCPAVTLVTVTRGGVVQHVPLGNDQPTDLIRVRRGAGVLDVPMADVQPDDIRIGDTVGPRANARDENPSSQPHAPGTPAPIRSEGLGRTPIPA